MWYLVINQNSERFFIKDLKTKGNFYFVSENEERLEIKNINEITQYRMVGEAFEYEKEWLNKLVNDNKDIITKILNSRIIEYDSKCEDCIFNIYYNKKMYCSQNSCERYNDIKEK